MKSGKLAAISVSVVEGILLQNLVEGIVMSSSLVTLNPLLTKLVPSRRLDSGFVLFCVSMDLDSTSVHRRAKK